MEKSEDLTRYSVLRTPNTYYSSFETIANQTLIKSLYFMESWGLRREKYHVAALKLMIFDVR